MAQRAAALLAGAATILSGAAAAKAPSPAADEVPSAAAAGGPWTLVLLADPTAVCLDGSPAAMFLRAGAGENASSFIIFFEGGGWCESEADCLARSATPLGSSKSYAPTTSWSQRDVLDVDCATNPRFCNWSSAYLPYCDGASRAGAVDGPVAVEGGTLHFAGARVLNATLAALLSPAPGGAALPGFPSLARAATVLVTGSSAGGLATYLHADTIADAVAAAAPAATVLAAPEVGFFIDGESIWRGARIMTGVFARVAAMQNVTRAPLTPARARCLQATPPALQWQCWFLAPRAYSYLRTPTFMLNSAWDEWQTSNILAPNVDTEPHVTTYAPFAGCIENPRAGCNATQFGEVRGGGGGGLGGVGQGGRVVWEGGRGEGGAAAEGCTALAVVGARGVR